MPACQPSARLNALTLSGNIPVSVTIELTRRCPLACLHCYLPQTRGRARPGRELSTAQWKEILGQLAVAGGLYLVFTGGEPLLRPDLAELCRYAKKLNFDVRVFSSGHGLTPHLAAEFKAAGVSAFELSFYGREAVHDAVTGRAGSFAASLSAARLLKKKGIAVKMKTPLLSLNVGEISRLKALARREGFGLSFDPVLSPADDGDKTALRYRLSGRRLAKAIGELSPPSPGPAPAPPGAMDFLCGAGRNVCAVDPAGNLSACLQVPIKLGNLRRLNFDRLWKNSPWLKRWRGAGLKDLYACAGCSDLPFCSRCPGLSLLEEGNLFAPNRPACEMAAILRRKTAWPPRRGRRIAS